MSAHAILSPSAAERWLTCPGSVSWAEPEDDDPSEFAAEGTVAHLIRAECLSLGMEPDDFIGQTVRADGYTFEVTRDMAEHLSDGIDRIRGDLGPDGQMFVEYRTDLREWIPDGFGTTDCGIARPDRFIIDDLKYGAGVPVSPVENKQLMIYALGFWWNIGRHLSDARDVTLRIDQPRIHGAGGEWETTIDDLLVFAEEVLRPGALRTLEPDAPLKPSTKGCQWCSRRKECDVRAAYFVDLIGQKFENLTGSSLTMVERHSLTPERRSHILLHRSEINKWLEELHTSALDDALSGRPTPGMKAIYGRRGYRSWRDEDRAGQVLTEKLGEAQAYERKLISPAAAEKIFGKKSFKADEALSDLVALGEAKPVLVSEETPGDPIQSHAQKLAAMSEQDLLGGDET